MKKLLIMDEQNYDPGLEVIYRLAVRGIIIIDGKLLMIEDSFGEVKLPGGGTEENEDDRQVLMREVKEETGYDVIPETIRPFGEIEEKRLSVHEPMIWNQISRLYFCDVSPELGECGFTENERKYGFHKVLNTIDEAIAKNAAMFEKERELPWNQREYKTLLLLKDYLARNKR